MGAVTKRVNVYAKFPVRSVDPVIHGVKKNTDMTISDILKCLCRGARVEEILPDGKTVNLNMNNYYTDNTTKIVASIHTEQKSTPVISDNEVVTHEEDVVKIEDTTVVQEELAVEEEVPEAPIEAQVVETETLETEEDAKVEEDVEENATPETEAEPTVAGVNATNNTSSKKNNKKKK